MWKKSVKHVIKNIWVGLMVDGVLIVEKQLLDVQTGIKKKNVWYVVQNTILKPTI